MSSPDSYTFAKVLIREAGEAFAFHERISDGDSHIWPRTETELRQYAQDGFLFCVRRTETRVMVGLCYAKLDAEMNAWEIGGLAVESDERRHGVGGVLVRFALAHTFTFNDPWNNGQRVIAHVHESNQSPRSVLKALGFDFTKTIEVPTKAVPKGMKLNDKGALVGDEFDFTDEGLKQLVIWLNGSVSLVGDAKAILDFGEIYTLDQIRRDLDEIATSSTAPGRPS